MKPETELQIKQMDTAVISVLGQKNLLGFERAYAISTAIQKLSEMLTPEYMKPIMAMQGNKLGLKTDKDKSGGYPENVVKNCLIEAVLMGLQPYGNQFNIISGSTYPTKEGCGYLLDNTIEGLMYDIVCNLPKINAEKTSASIEVVVGWSLNGGTRHEKTIPIPLKMDAYTSVDALIGKATRKARAWLLSTVTGFEVTDGEVTDAVLVETKPLNGLTPSSVKWVGAVAALRNGTQTIEDIKSKYTVSAENEAKLIQESAA